MTIKRDWLDVIEEGAAGGVLATVPMTAVMLAAQRAGLLGEAPPKKITDAAVDAVDADAAPATRGALTTVAHFGFGATTGALFSALRPGRPSIGRAALEGAAFGTAVWAASYAGWVPALGIMPPPGEDRPFRPTTMIVAHWVFGAALGAWIAYRRGGSR
jgi:hypothetical protein